MIPVKRVEMAPNQVMGGIGLDGGGQFIPAQEYLVYTHNLYY